MEGLWDALRASGQGLLASTLLRHGVRSVSDVALKSSVLQENGVLQWQIEAILAAGPQQAVSPAQVRADLPVAFQGKRANLSAALEAARPNQRARSLAALDEDVLARSTAPAHESRLRTYQAVCKAWDLEPFPLSNENVRAFAASLKAGGYRSAAVYFQSICSHQTRHLHLPVDSLLRHVIRDCLRSILRGLGAQRLKESFDAMRLNDCSFRFVDEAFSFDQVSHCRDLCIIGLWYMLRESELASARLSHLTLTDSELRLLIPIHKTDCYGQLCERVLSCSCRVRRHNLCVWHAAERHLIRCQHNLGGGDASRFPLFHTSNGQTASKHQFIMALRSVISFLGIPLSRRDPSGKDIQRFHGHVLRVSGAQMLFAAGVHLQLIQLLGRWTSMTILRYTQQAGLNLLPSIPDVVLNNRPDVGSLAIAPAVGPQVDSDALSRAAPRISNESSRSGASSSSRTSTSGDITALRAELQILKQAVIKPPAAYVIRSRSKIVHLGCPHELSNPPSSWRSRCGWAYGQANFLRVSEISDPLRACQKCFDRNADSGSDVQSSGSGFSDLEPSDSDSS